MKNLRLVVILVLVGLVAGCAGHNTFTDVPSAEGYVVGFWSALVHGMVWPFGFIISLFDSDVRMYEVHNTGAWYDLGFVIGAGILFPIAAAITRAIILIGINLYRDWDMFQ